MPDNNWAWRHNGDNSLILSGDPNGEHLRVDISWSWRCWSFGLRFDTPGNCSVVIDFGPLCIWWERDTE